MKTKLHYVFSTTIFLIAFSAFGQNSLWKRIETIKHPEKLSKFHLDKSKVKLFDLDLTSLKEKLTSTNKTVAKKNTTSSVINIPTNNGKLEAFKIYEASVFSTELAKKYPNIKSYVGYSLDNSGTKLRMSVSPQGIQTMITYLDKPTTFMQPITKDSNEYVFYDRGMKVNSESIFKCETIDILNKTINKSKASKINEGGANNQTLQKFRIAISTTSEYTAYHDDGNAGNGDAIADALAAINNTLSRVNEVFETDMAVTFELVDATELIYNDAVNDPYSDANIGTDESNSNNLDGWSLQLQNTLSTSNALGNNLTERNSAYDIGHLLGASGGGGNAGCIGCVCIDDTASNTDNNKGSGFTSPADDIPEGDTFDINYVIHEIGHQMGANHTWAFTTEGTNVNSEPGSGTTIMAYAGIQGDDNVELDSDDYFHYHSIKQILDNLGTKSCQTTEAISNNPPITDAGNNYIIPAGTPYILKGTATDTDSGDNLTYCWEQIDSGTTDYLNFGPTLTTGSMNRSLPPSNSSNRYIPRLSSVLDGNVAQTNPGIGSDWETVATVDRFLNWALTVRDRAVSSPTGGQTSYDTMQIEVIDGTTLNPVGPFIVTSQSTSNISWTQNTTETITWDVANTDDSGGINTQFVNILLSTDGGLNFNTTLKSNTPNDGMEDITVPNIAAPFCRIMVEPINNIYYSVNSTDFAIGYTVVTTCNQQFISNPNPLNLSILDGQETTNIINVPSNGIISDLKVNVDVSHTFISDLTVVLSHPNNSTSVTLWEENCFNTGDDDFDIIFEDGAIAVVCATPTTGTYIPVNSLSVFDGLDNTGNWELSVTDNYSGDTGSLNDWYLEFCITTATLSNSTDIALEDFKVFPNPNKGEFTIKLNGSKSDNITLNVYDLRGRSIYKNSYQNNGSFSEKIRLKNVQSGMYILSLNDGLKNSSKKIIIE